ncbi:metalloregulator ArsR/SmtB family transcription factor [Ectothiorhodospira lacustris]|uniref:metalloregulator ArsR/SmtB family transcription factor n=1 Tax=Ectothiorhodospira lacustris TaxID=2899127 RepID=UPI001EE92CF7|nr:metalloregulator ArsR/SmtB family transcription factor [Ectothiorhodospira lacustris]MCG5500795.1 metalloregulator ArsR/SmtB family transcription factor [Ectothiorhodospira lacustris]MCG5509360.1 metalloregulator ArsR/SmtB family transcription factor [Ectothiorhodospira lacustris]MCG5521414.1 metalloregulator ArsR/SmtB family transcription factor [Ectothiorhodospira lacustris]
MTISPESVFKALSDPTRLRCLVLLTEENSLCVCELTHAIGVPQPKMSRHLALLRESGLVADQRRGQWIFYRINPALPVWVREVLRQTAQACADKGPYTGDRTRLDSMGGRPEKGCAA